MHRPGGNLLLLMLLVSIGVICYRIANPVATLQEAQSWAGGTTVVHFQPVEEIEAEPEGKESHAGAAQWFAAGVVALTGVAIYRSSLRKPGSTRPGYLHERR